MSQVLGPMPMPPAAPMADWRPLPSLKAQRSDPKRSVIEPTGEPEAVDEWGQQHRLGQRLFDFTGGRGW